MIVEMIAVLMLMKKDRLGRREDRYLYNNLGPFVRGVLHRRGIETIYPIHIYTAWHSYPTRLHLKSDRVPADKA